MDGVFDVCADEAGSAELAVELGYLVTVVTVLVVEFTHAGVREGQSLP